MQSHHESHGEVSPWQTATTNLFSNELMLSIQNLRTYLRTVDYPQLKGQRDR